MAGRERVDRVDRQIAVTAKECSILHTEKEARLLLHTKKEHPLSHGLSPLENRKKHIKLSL
jgi:hypothetical protein